jgi:hypothetical protein
LRESTEEAKSISNGAAATNLKVSRKNNSTASWADENQAAQLVVTSMPSFPIWKVQGNVMSCLLRPTWGLDGLWFPFPFPSKCGRNNRGDFCPPPSYSLLIPASACVCFEGTDTLLFGILTGRVNLMVCGLSRQGQKLPLFESRQRTGARKSQVGIGSPVTFRNPR